MSQSTKTYIQQVASYSAVLPGQSQPIVLSSSLLVATAATVSGGGRDGLLDYGIEVVVESFTPPEKGQSEDGKYFVLLCISSVHSQYVI